MYNGPDESGPPPSYGSTPSTSSDQGGRPPPFRQQKKGPNSRYWKAPHYSSPNEETPLYNETSEESYSSPSRLTIFLAAVGILLLGFIFHQNYVIHRRADSIDPIDWAAQREAWVLDHESWALDRQLWQLDRARWQEDRKDWDEGRHEWEREREERKRRKEEKERQRREEEERKRREDEDRLRSKMYWDAPQPAERCMVYETRRYQARLWNIPFLWNWEKACRNTPVTIAGVNISTPDQCVNRGWGGMYGIWDVKSEQTDCQSYWSPMWNRGCTADGSRNRRFDSRMHGMQHGDDWNAMCRTTPAQINGITYSNPTHCELKGIRKFFHTEWGMYGTWELYDPDC